MEKISLIVNFLPVATTLSRSRPAVSHCLLSAGSVARPGAGDVATEGRHQGRGDRQRRDVGGDQLVVARPQSLSFLPGGACAAVSVRTGQSDSEEHNGSPCHRL